MFRARVTPAISIPFSTIKRDREEIEEIIEKEFQFHLVRLKDVCLTADHQHLSYFNSI